MNISIIYNPNATGLNENVLSTAISTFSKSGKVTLLESKYSGHTIELIKKANEFSDLIVTLGGDGTLGEAYLGLGQVKQNAYYSHISVGTANDTADNFGLSKENQIESIDMFSNLDNLNEEDVDMVTAGDIPFGYVSCCGTFTNLTYETPKSLKRAFGKLGYYMFSGVAGLCTIPDIFNRPLKLVYNKNGKKVVSNALTMIVSNTKTFAGLKLFPKAKINDGNFEVTILKSIPSELIPFIHDLFDKEGENFDVEKYSRYIDCFTTDNLKVNFLNGDPRLGFNHDGDHSLVSLDSDNSLEYKVRKKVKMLLPKKL